MPMTSHSRTRARLRSVAQELRTAIEASAGTDELAYAALTVDDEVHPWTHAAEQAWRRARQDDGWRHHHLAVLHHARAYDLEAARDDEAFSSWERALTHWSEVIGDDRFWTDLAEGLAARMDAELPPALVPSVRANLPRDLLAPHVDLALTYRTTAPERARRHVETIKRSGFDPEVIADVRTTLVRNVVGTAPAAVKTGRFDDMIAELQSWLSIDDDNEAVTQALLYVYRKYREGVWREDDGWDRIVANVGEANALLGPILDRMPAPTGPLAKEVARHEYWRGFAYWCAAHRQFKGNEMIPVLRAFEHDCAKAMKCHERAKALDPDLALDSYYNDIDTFLAYAYRLSGVCRFLCTRQGADDDVVGATQHLRTAIRLHPKDFQSHYLLVQVLLSGHPVTDEAGTEAGRVTEKARPLALAAYERRALAEIEAMLLDYSLTQTGGGEGFGTPDIRALLLRALRDME